MRGPSCTQDYSDAANALRQAIRRSDIVRDRTKLVVFLGTPHRGSAYAGWGQVASNLARLALQDSNKKIPETLEVNNRVLDNIHEEFKTIVYTASMKVHSFQEAQGITGMKGVSEKVCYLPQGVDATVWSTWIGHHPYGSGNI
jgi:hypothetical protein